MAFYRPEREVHQNTGTSNGLLNRDRYHVQVTNHGPCTVSLRRWRHRSRLVQVILILRRGVPVKVVVSWSPVPARAEVVPWGYDWLQRPPNKSQHPQHPNS